MKKIGLQMLVMLLFATGSTVKGQVPVGTHEFRFGVGVPLILDTHTDDDYYLADAASPPGHMSSQYKGDLIGTPAINFSYSYQCKKWLAFGATAGYIGMFQKTYDLYSRNTFSKRGEHFIGVTPTVRFDFCRTKIMKLYSCVGLGLGYYFEQERYSRSGRSDRDSYFIPTVDLTPIGISVGKKVFGFCELSLSSHGFMKAGIGYRFN